MAHRCEHLCSTSQLWLPHLALCIVPPECFQDLCVWSRAMGSKSGKLRNIADCDTLIQSSIPDVVPIMNPQLLFDTKWLFGSQIYFNIHSMSLSRIFQ